MDIKKIRKDFNLTQAELAKELGVLRLTIYRWEKGLTKPSPLAKRALELWLEVQKK